MIPHSKPDPAYLYSLSYPPWLQISSHSPKDLWVGKKIILLANEQIQTKLREADGLVWQWLHRCSTTGLNKFTYFGHVKALWEARDGKSTAYYLGGHNLPDENDFL